MIDYAGPKNEALVSEQNPSMIRVVAPASLPGGYEVTVEGKDAAPFVVTIPEGGVQSGDIFLAPIPDGYKMEELLNVPKGRWKDDIFDVFKYGFFHPHLWCAMCCQEIAMGQVMQRMRLSWLGHRTLSDRAMSTYTTVLILVICYTIYSTILDCLEFYMYNDQDNFNHAITAAQNIGMILFLVWSIYALKKTRQHVRNEFSIPEQQCVGCEDCMCATFCGCCTVAQIARHTGDYETHPGVCCSATGLPDSTPLAAPMAV